MATAGNSVEKPAKPANKPEVKKSLMARVWYWTKIAFMVILFPVTLIWYAVKIIAWPFKVGTAPIWESFGSYIWGTVYREKDGSIIAVRFVSYSDMVHFHYPVWGGLICALLAISFPATIPYLAPALILLPLWALLVVKFDMPFDKVWLPVLILAITLPLADYGISVLSGNFTSWAYPWLEQNVSWLGIKGDMAGSYEFIWLIRKTFNAFGFEVSAGTHLFAACAWGLFLLASIFEAWMYNRFELDPKDIYRLQFGKGEARTPVYMRSMRVHIKDLLETVPLGFASLVITTGGRSINLRCIPFLAGGTKIRQAIDEIINSTASTITNGSKAVAAGTKEDAANLVRTHQDERGEVHSGASSDHGLEHATGDIVVHETDALDDFSNMDDEIETDQAI